MNEDWLIQHFIVISESEFIPMEGYIASIPFFLRTFSGLVSYESLVQKDHDVDAGWLVYFDAWKQRGILN